MDFKIRWINNHLKTIRSKITMRYYWEVLFSTEYFPYWEFTMLMMLALQLSMLWRLHRIENKIDILNEFSHHIIDEVEE